MLLALNGCASPDGVVARHEFLHVERVTVEGGDSLTVVAAPGARVNARLPPSLDVGGVVVRFSSSEQTPDSAYFTANTVAFVPDAAEGTLYASVCPRDQSVCRIVELPVPLR